jgi:hypothetical protein
MRRLILVYCLAITASAFGRFVHAQDDPKASAAKQADTAPKAPEPPTRYYRLEFVIQELGADGKPVNSRSYSTDVNTRPHGDTSMIKTGSRIPIIVGGPATSGGEKHFDVNYQYIDVGVNLSAGDVHEVGHQLAIFMKAEVSSLGTASANTTSDPVIRQNSWFGPVVIPVGKPTVVFSSDALESKGGMQVSMTATLLE